MTEKHGTGLKAVVEDYMVGAGVSWGERSHSLPQFPVLAVQGLTKQSP